MVKSIQWNDNMIPASQIRDREMESDVDNRSILLLHERADV